MRKDNNVFIASKFFIVKNIRNITMDRSIDGMVPVQCAVIVVIDAWGRA